MKFKTFIGIDISKNTLDFSVRNETEQLFHLQVENSNEGIKKVLEKCKSESIDLKSVLFCMEHTGIYNTVLLTFLSKKQYSVWVEQGLQIKKSLGVLRGKNDKVDSQRISEYAYRFQDKLRLWEPPRRILVRLKKLTGLRIRLIKTKVLLKKELVELTDFETRSISSITKRLCNPVINKIENQLKKVEEEIVRVIQEDDLLRGLFEIITSVEGVGQVTAWELLTTTNEFKNIKEGKRYACYAGVVPFDHSSGSSIRGKNRVNRMANKTVKQLLHMSALSSIVMKGEMKDYFERKVEEGKNKMAVLNAIRNKLVLRVFACVRDGRKYEKSYTYSLV